MAGMKILYIHQHFSTPAGAGGNRSYQMARALVEAGHSVTMVCGSHSTSATGLTGPKARGRREGVVEGIHVIELDLPYSNADGFFRRTFVFLKYMAQTAGMALTRGYDVIFTTSTPLTVGIPGILASLLRRKPFIFEVRDLWPELPRAMRVIRNPVVLKAMSVIEWLSYRSARRLIGLSPGIVEGIARRGIPHDRIALIPNGCDLDIFTVEEAKRPAGVAPDDLLALYPGTHGVANGLENVLAAAAVLERRGRSDIKIVLVGEGGRKPALIRQAQDLALENVLFLPAVPKRELAALLAGADLGIQSLANVPEFYYGTSPNKFFDYLASGLPVLCNYPGWIADLIQANRCGYAVAPDDPEAFADALEMAAAERSKLPVMGQNARALAEREFDRRILAEQWVPWVTEGRHQVARSHVSR